MAAAALAWPLWRGVPARQDRRRHFYAYDYAQNVFRAAPPGSVVVVKKDVQLYALWPLYEDEMAFKLEHGSEALFKKLDQRHVTELFDVGRRSVLAKRFWVV